jgi:hypothetical protein
MNGVNFFAIDHFHKKHTWKKLENEAAKWKDLKRLNDFVLLNFLESNIGSVHKDTNEDGEDNHARDKLFEPIVNLDSFLVEKVVGLSLIIRLKFDDFGVDIVQF